MSKIDKLSILGVRSFDNARSETIQFHTPLTLIVGYNGSGKTTIIECLKYATTGEQPPNSKGGAFVHDPKLAGEKEVLAQVKLSFRSTDHNRMVCTRSIQLTVKKDTRTTKGLDASIVMYREAEKRTLSSRIAEMDMLMPRYLGVSKSVLDSVIFCHQDESLWPLSAPGDLKKKFDELFEAMKYTKAIDNIKVLQKQQRTYLADYRKDEEKYKADKQRGERASAVMTKLDQEITALRSQSSQLTEQIQEVTRATDEAFSRAERAGIIVGQLGGKRIEERTKRESVESLHENLQALEESDEQLQEMLRQYEERVHVIEEDKERSTARYRELVSSIEALREQASAKDRICGVHEAQKQSYDNKIAQRERLIKDTARSHSIRGFDFNIDQDQAQAFMARMSQLTRDQASITERARRENQEELQIEQKKLNEINEKRSALLQSKESSRHAIASHDRKLDALQKQLDASGIDEGAKHALEIEVEDSKTKLENAKRQGEILDFSARLSRIEDDIQKLDVRKEVLDEEMAEASRQAKESAELEYVSSKLKKQRDSLVTMQGAHGEKITRLIGPDWSPTTVGGIFDTLLAERNSLHTEAEKQLEGVNRECEQVQSQMSAFISDLNTKKSTLKSSAQSILETTGHAPEIFRTELAACETDLESAKTNADASMYAIQYFDSCIKAAKEKSVCRSCRRNFVGDNRQREVDLLIKTMTQEKDRFQVDKAQAEIADLEKVIASWKTMTSVHDRWETLQQEIPALEAQITSEKSTYDGIVSRIDEADSTAKQRREHVREAEALSRTVKSISTAVDDIAVLETQVEELKCKQKAAGLTRGSDAIQTEQKQINDQLRSLRSTLAKTTSERDRMTKGINTIQLELSELEKKLSAAEWQLREKVILQNQTDDVKTLLHEQQESIKQKEEELKALSPQQQQIQARYDEAVQRGADRDHQMQADLNKLNNSINELKIANADITAYLEKGGVKQLEIAKEELANVRVELQGLQDKSQATVREVKALEDQARDHGATKRSISDNIRYRRDMQALERVREEIAELEGRNAESEKARYDAQGQQHHRRRQELMGQQATIAGQIKSKDESLQQQMQSWDMDYKDAARNYKEAHVKAETSKACIEDLGRYGGALDNAIMKFHSLKMEDINRIIDELWRKTYQGTDVDTIIIRSESENTKSNKSYNYRVVMMKQDTEMDMRGRCSAGQKVLACIIIRLALAECFGVNCGIIALDEPTTNLDRDNIRALAKSLGEIINMRKAQKNFQLIVITHDEEFLRFMNCSDHAEWFYRVGRNDKQKSEIQKQRISEVL